MLWCKKQMNTSKSMFFHDSSMFCIDAGMEENIILRWGVCGFCGKIPKTATLCLHDPSKFTTSSGSDLTKSAMIQA